MNGYHIIFNPKTMRFNLYNMPYYGCSKEFAEKAVDYINQLEDENRRLKEQLKQLKLSDLNGNQLNNIKLIMENKS